MVNTVDRVRIRTTTWDSVKRQRVEDGGTREELISAPNPVQHHYHNDSRPRIPASMILDTSNGHNTDKLPVATQLGMRSSTPGPTQNPLLTLSHPHYGLPGRLIQNLQAMGIRSIYPWQSSCLLGRGNLDGKRNLVYTAPTGGGKSLVADVLMFKRVLEGRKAMLVLPYIALVQEKLKWLRRAVEGVEKSPKDEGSLIHAPSLTDQAIRLAGFYGGSKTRDHWLDIDIVVCTIEKVSSVFWMAGRCH